jgi:hypothetical protein
LSQTRDTGKEQRRAGHTGQTSKKNPKKIQKQIQNQISRAKEDGSHGIERKI